MLVNIYVVMWLYIIVRLVEVNKFVRKDDDFFDLIFLVFCIVQIYGSSCYFVLFWVSLVCFRFSWFVCFVVYSFFLMVFNYSFDVILMGG